MSTHEETATSRLRALCYVTLAYIVAFAAACAVLGPARDAIGEVAHASIWVAAIADVVATLVIFGFSFGFKNSSFYDAYWSVAPPLLGLYFATAAHDDFAFPARAVLAFALTLTYGIRLTHNWARGWTGLHHVDWRYVDLKAKTGKAYWAVSLFGIHLFPTALVFLGCLPLYVVANGDRPLGAWDVCAATVTALAIGIELVADNQLRRFVNFRVEPGEILETGLWRFSRHPNYFGEMLFWWGLFLFVVPSIATTWWAGIGALSISLMFVFISIPMIEKRSLARRPGYAERAEKTSLLIPWPPKGAQAVGAQAVGASAAAVSTMAVAPAPTRSVEDPSLELDLDDLIEEEPGLDSTDQIETSAYASLDPAKAESVLKKTGADLDALFPPLDDD